MGNFLTSWVTTSFLGRTLLQRVSSIHCCRHLLLNGSVVRCNAAHTERCPYCAGDLAARPSKNGPIITSARPPNLRRNTAHTKRNAKRTRNHFLYEFFVLRAQNGYTAGCACWHYIWPILAKTLSSSEDETCEQWQRYDLTVTHSFYSRSAEIHVMGVPVTTVWHVIRLRMEETASRYGG
jgi:hypothetical protein